MSWNTLKEVLKKAAERNPEFAQALEESEAVRRWPEAVGDVIAKHAEAVSVRAGVLRVRVDHPIWRSELQFRKRQILEKLNSGLNRKIEEIFIT
jgi:predicted nucleic acid-binding Zn ribbon protein